MKLLEDSKDGSESEVARRFDDEKNTVNGRKRRLRLHKWLNNRWGIAIPPSIAEAQTTAPGLHHDSLGPIFSLLGRRPASSSWRHASRNGAPQRVTRYRLNKSHGRPGVNYDERLELFEEALQVIRAVWTSDEISFEGKHFTARGITAHPRPLSQPHPQGRKTPGGLPAD